MNPKPELWNDRVEILIVEDSSTQAVHLQQILEQQGYCTLVVKNGKEALTLMRQHKPTLIISDIVMPEMDGYELCRRIKADEPLKDVPVILLTALSDPTDILNALKCGASSFITKPYDKAYLLSRVEYVLLNQKLREAEKVKMGMDIFFAGQRYFITSERWQILDLLLSTYETAVEKNLELIKVQEKLKMANERLEEKVAERTSALVAEIAERKRAEEERKRAEETLRRNEEHFRSLIENALDIITVLNSDGAIRYASPSVSRVLGYRPEDLISKNIFELMHPDDAPYIFKTFLGVVQKRGVTPTLEFRFRHKEGSWRILEAIGNNLLDDSGVAGIVVNSRDITQRKQAEETIRHLAYYDPLTKLPNRTLLNDRLAVELAQAHRTQQMLALVFLDLDRFKTINDTLGHTVGDRLLQGVTQRLTSCLREGDTIARLGGDEFMFLLPGIAHAEDAAKVAQRILEVLNPSFHLEGHEFHITASIGIVLYPTDGEDTKTLLKNADVAMYRAKDRGRNTYQFYTPAMNAAALERLILENSLRRGLEREEFVVYYQPQVNLYTGQIVGAEALVRWQHPELGLVPPMKFIPLAEETGLIIPLGEWVLRTACAQNKAWQEAGFPPLRIAVNLSAHIFKHKDVVKTIVRILKETGLDPDYLDLELTEGAVMENAETTITMLRELKEMGMHISIDDFGTGYSSLSYLKRFPIDILKIDQSFVRDIITDPDDAAIARLIITMAHTLKLKVIAEGVETEEQLLFLRSHECDEMQGYYFSRPVPAEAFTQLLREGRRLTLPIQN